MFQSPRSAKKLYFDVIPRATDEYLQQLDAYNRRRGTPANPLDNPVWSVHGGAPPAQGSPVSFGLLLNLVSAANASDKAILWGFISRHVPGATPRDRAAARPARPATPSTTTRTSCGPRSASAPPDARERAAFADLLTRLKALPAGLPRRRDDPERGLRGGQGGGLRAAARRGSAPSTRCCWARPRDRGSAPSPPSSGWSGRSDLIERALETTFPS